MKNQIFLDIQEQLDLIELQNCYYAYFQCKKYSVQQLTT